MFILSRNSQAVNFFSREGEPKQNSRVSNRCRMNILPQGKTRRRFSSLLRARHGVPCNRTTSNTASTINTPFNPPHFERLSKRRRGYPSETKVKRGRRIVHGDKELHEKLGRRDLCPCGSGKLFKKCCLHSDRF